MKFNENVAFFKDLSVGGCVRAWSCQSPLSYCYNVSFGQEANGIFIRIINLRLPKHRCVLFSKFYSNMIISLYEKTKTKQEYSL